MSIERIYLDECTGCKLCYLACPVDVICYDEAVFQTAYEQMQAAFA